MYYVKVADTIINKFEKDFFCCAMHTGGDCPPDCDDMTRGSLREIISEELAKIIDTIVDIQVVTDVHGERRMYILNSEGDMYDKPVKGCTWNMTPSPTL